MNDSPFPFRLVLVLLSTIVLQVAVASRLRIIGVAPDLPLLVTLAAGIVGGRDKGAVVGFAAGLLFDLTLSTPLGLAALSYCIAGYVVGALEASAIRSEWWLPVAGWLGGSALGVGLFAVIGALIGEDALFTGDLPYVIGIVAGWNAILGPLAMWVMRWAEVDRGPLRGVAW